MAKEQVKGEGIVAKGYVKGESNMAKEYVKGEGAVARNGQEAMAQGRGASAGSLSTAG